ncbi:hypothetical protein Mal4_19610 [Maioricimonas rarisocia]|uniref:Uncharacterized protein n=1 Tax=Maioricimonas rarisocia TaxID=2528026 RepID=A0A517Z590_9PLAN|nr:hypothetical protein [Maioricimonas rarisocia]QDU37646.1 hypothetical protein Mal4_19610 [Maioricimonas rarisocia]
MIRESVMAHLSTTETSTVDGLLESCGLERTPESASALELLCFYTPELRLEGRRWKLARQSKASAILTAIDNYAISTGKKIFRASAALAHLPVEEQPTDDELENALRASHGQYQLLPNVMIKKSN